MSMFLFLFFSRLLLCSFFWLKELFKSEKWFNNLVTSFFLENAKKIWVGWTMLNEKKREREREDALGLIKQVS